MPRTLSELRSVGINLDLPPYDVPPEQFTEGRNVQMRDGLPGRILGYEDVFGTPLGPPVWLLPTLTEDAAFWVYGTDDRIATQSLAVTDGVNHFDISPAGGVNADDLQNAFTGANFNGVPVINWQGDAPVFWDLQTANPSLELPGWEANARCGALRAFKNYLIALDYTDGGGIRIENLIKWSDAAEPGQLPTTWTPAPDNDAGFLSAAATEGPVIDGAALRDQFLVFKNSSTYTLDFVGGQFVFGLRKLFVTSGILSRNCFAEFQGKLVLFIDGDIVLTDGVSVRSIADRRIRSSIFSTISSTDFERSFVASYTQRREIWFCFPTSGEYPSFAAVWDYERDQWSIRDLFETPFAAQGIVQEAGAAGSDAWDDAVGSWDEATLRWDETVFTAASARLLVADPDGGFYLVDSGVTNPDGSDIVGELQRESLDFGQPLNVKTVRAVWPRVEGINGDQIEISVGSQFDVDDPIQWSAPVPFTIGTDRKVDTFATGRYLSFRFRSVGGNAWQLPSWSVEFGATGARY